MRSDKQRQIWVSFIQNCHTDNFPTQHQISCWKVKETLKQGNLLFSTENNLFPLFLADLDKKYRNEIGMDKNNSGTYMDYDYF